jgi:epoxyqueuosine reductase
MTQNDWDEVTEELFNRLFEVSAVQRTGLNGLKRNLEFLK